MTMFRPSLTRRGLLATVTAGTVSAALDGCGTATRPRERLLPSAAQTGSIMIIRHAEKPATSGPPHGVDADGNADGHSLTVRGWTRAGALLQLFASNAGTGRGGLGRPDAVYAAGGSGGEGQRPRETVTPLAARLGLTVDTTYAKGGESALAKECAARPGPTLICWEHGEIPAILAAFDHVDPAPPSKWPGSRFDLVWVLTPRSRGWSFTQVPQLLLDGDRGVL